MRVDFDKLPPVLARDALTIQLSTTEEQILSLIYFIVGNVPFTLESRSFDGILKVTAMHRVMSSGYAFDNGIVDLLIRALNADPSITQATVDSAMKLFDLEPLLNVYLRNSQQVTDRIISMFLPLSPVVDDTPLMIYLERQSPPSREIVKLLRPPPETILVPVFNKLMNLNVDAKLRAVLLVALLRQRRASSEHSLIVNLVLSMRQELHSNPDFSGYTVIVNRNRSMRRLIGFNWSPTTYGLLNIFNSDVTIILVKNGLLAGYMAITGYTYKGYPSIKLDYLEKTDNFTEGGFARKMIEPLKHYARLAGYYSIVLTTDRSPGKKLFYRVYKPLGFISDGTEGGLDRYEFMLRSDRPRASTMTRELAALHVS